MTIHIIFDFSNHKFDKMIRFRRGSNSRPSACKADVITTTLRNQYIDLSMKFRLWLQTQVYTGLWVSTSSQTEVNNVIFFSKRNYHNLISFCEWNSWINTRIDLLATLHTKDKILDIVTLKHFWSVKLNRFWVSAQKILRTNVSTNWRQNKIRNIYY